MTKCESIQICDEVWNDSQIDGQKLPIYDDFEFEQSAKNNDYERWYINRFSAMAAHVILHEVFSDSYSRAHPYH